ncbi:MAG TPA: hypothetical protein VLA72_09080 [Anaerolineales bacterium]|nr:hypothetical protein [Anaerolineales bacterium]
MSTRKSFVKCILSAILVLFLAGCSTGLRSQPPNPIPTCNVKDNCSGSSSGCTVFTVSKGDQVFFGGNDDYINPDSYYWVDPGNEDNYGAIWIGTRDNVQQGVNEKGLAYDANGLPRVDTNPHLEREPVSGGYSSYPIQILQECATVEEVISWVNTHQWHSYMLDQLHFADATGDAVIISAGADGEIVFTRKPPGDGFLVSTNFNVANPANTSNEYPCWRYDRATEKLKQVVYQEGELTFQDAVNVLDAVHVEEATSSTLESMVADLPHGIVYLYYFYQYDKPVVLNVTEEIANPRADGPLSELFPEDVQQEAARRFKPLSPLTRIAIWLINLVGIDGAAGIVCLTSVLIVVTLVIFVRRWMRKRTHQDLNRKGNAGSET